MVIRSAPPRIAAIDSVVSRMRLSWMSFRDLFRVDVTACRMIGGERLGAGGVVEGCVDAVCGDERCGDAVCGDAVCGDERCGDEGCAEGVSGKWSASRP